jgi:hypothetical protein
MSKTDADRDRWLDEILTLKEAAAIRRVSVDTIKDLIATGRLNGVRISKARWGMKRREAMRDVLRPAS